MVGCLGSQGEGERIFVRVFLFTVDALIISK
jgi:hypothetical protein